MLPQFPLFGFEKDDCSMRLIESPDRVLHYMEIIDLENEEYLFWDSTGHGVSIVVEKDRVKEIALSNRPMSLSDAFATYCRAFGLQAPLEGRPLDVWERIQSQHKQQPVKKGWLSRLFRRQ
jgi:hypothetical protein